MSRVYWFNLPTKIKSEIKSRQSILTCLDETSINTAIENITWFRLPEKLKALVDTINSNGDLAANNYIMSYSKWFRLDAEVDLLLAYLDETVCN